MNKQVRCFGDFESASVMGSMPQLLAHSDWNASNLAVLFRRLAGDFSGLAQKIAAHLELCPHQQIELSFLPDEERISAVAVFEDIKPSLKPEEIVALEQVLDDMKQTSHFETVLNVEGSKYGEEVVVEEWHHDVGWKQGRVLCTYNFYATQGVSSRHARFVDEEFYDVEDDAPVFEMSIGSMSRHVVKNNPETTNPFIHRRSPKLRGLGPRLFLQSVAGEWVTLEQAHS